jgi:hypothetical protein
MTTKWKAENCFKGTKYPQKREYCPYSCGGWTAMCLAVPERRGCNDFWYPTSISKVRREQCPIVQKLKRFSIIKPGALVALVNGEIGNDLQFNTITT